MLHKTTGPSAVHGRSGGAAGVGKGCHLAWSAAGGKRERAGLEQHDQSLEIERPAEEVALPVVAAVLAQKTDLILSLRPFGDDLRASALGQGAWTAAAQSPMRLKVVVADSPSPESISTFMRPSSTMRNVHTNLGLA